MKHGVKFISAAGFLLLACLGTSATEVAILRNGFTIRHERREPRDEVTRLYFVEAEGSYVDIPTEDIVGFEAEEAPPPPRPIAKRGITSTLGDVVEMESRRNNLDPKLVMSVIRAESAFHSNAVSQKGAQGLMQLMPQTASQMGVRNALDPVSNVEGGTKYLRQMLDRYNNDLNKALAAYNAGPASVDQYRGVPPYAETRAYVARIVGDFNRQKVGEPRVKKESARKIKATVPLATEPASDTMTAQ